MPASEIQVRRNSRVFAELSAAVLELGHRLQFRVHGESMRPNLSDGDTVLVAPAVVSELQPGDLALIQNAGRASDVRVTPVLAVADIGRATCNVTVVSQRGGADVRVGSESHSVEEGKAYRVRAENEISSHQWVSPDVENYHGYHNHKPCAPVEMIKGQAPVAAGESRFMLVTGIVAGGLMAWGVTEALESPSRP
jgi:hypothetical protein